MDQMGYMPYVFDFGQFNKLVKDSFEEYKNKQN
jgi:hypothetical protein